MGLNASFTSLVRKQRLVLKPGRMSQFQFPWVSILPPGGVGALLQGTDLLIYFVTFVRVPIVSDAVGFALSLHGGFLSAHGAVNAGSKPFLSSRGSRSVGPAAS